MTEERNTPEEVTGLLLDWSNGSDAAYKKLVPLVDKSYTGSRIAI